MSTDELAHPTRVDLMTNDLQNVQEELRRINAALARTWVYLIAVSAAFLSAAIYASV